MKYVCTVISVADIKVARKFYEDLFSLEVYQDYGRNIPVFSMSYLPSAATCSTASNTW